MEKYSKPIIITQRECQGIIPLAAAVAGLSAADVVAAIGIAAGLASTLGGKDNILPKKNVLNQLDLLYNM